MILHPTHVVDARKGIRSLKTLHQNSSSSLFLIYKSIHPVVKKTLLQKRGRAGMARQRSKSQDVRTATM